MVIVGVRRRWRLLRVTLAALAALGLVGVAFAGIESPVGAQQRDGVDQATTDRRAATSIIFKKPTFAPGVAPNIRVGERFKIEIHDVPQGVTAHIYLTGPIQPEGRCPASTREAMPRRVGPGPSTGSGYYDSMKIDGCAVGTGNIRVVNADESERYATASIKVRAATGTRTPTPTPRPTSAPQPPQPPVSGAPSFGNVAAADYRFRVGHRLVDLTLPAASGGNGTLTYSLAPPLGNGLAFDAATQTISGTPAAAANRATYIYTVTDADRKTAQIPVSITVFDIAETVLEGGGARPLLESTWGVLGYRAVVLREGTISRTDGHQLRLRIPAGAGFQFGRTCTWPAAAPTDTTMLESSWLPSNYGSHVVRCALGGGDAVRVEVQARLGDGGTPAVLYDATMDIKQSWHRHDHTVAYYIRGASVTTIHGVTVGTSITGVTTDTQEGLFPASTSTPNPALTEPANYVKAAEAWENVRARGVTVTPATAEAGSDVVIEGYWDPNLGKGDDSHCGGSIACTHAAGTYPHIGNGQRFLIENPPHWGHEDNPRMWTDDLGEWWRMTDKFEYLPRLLAHELGHTLGLGDGANGDDVMAWATREPRPCSFTAQVIDRCGFSDGDMQGLRAIYAHHRDDH